MVSARVSGSRFTRLDVLRWLNAASYRRVTETDPRRPTVIALVGLGQAGWRNPYFRTEAYISPLGLKALREAGANEGA